MAEIAAESDEGQEIKCKPKSLLLPHWNLSMSKKMVPNTDDAAATALETGQNRCILGAVSTGWNQAVRVRVKVRALRLCLR